MLIKSYNGRLLATVTLKYLWKNLHVLGPFVAIIIIGPFELSNYYISSSRASRPIGKINTLDHVPAI